MEQGGPSNANDYYVLKPWNVGKNGKGSCRMPIPTALTSGLRHNKPVELLVDLCVYNDLEINVDAYGHFSFKVAGWRSVVQGKVLYVGEQVLLKIEHLGRVRYSGVTFEMLIRRKEARIQHRRSSEAPGLSTTTAPSTTRSRQQRSTSAALGPSGATRPSVARTFSTVRHTTNRKNSAPPAPFSSSLNSSSSDNTSEFSTGTGGSLSSGSPLNTNDIVEVDERGNIIDYDDSDYDPIETQVARTASDPIIISDDE